MARVFPFKALRPRPEYAARVAAPPYDVLSSAEAKTLAAGNPASFLHVDKAEIGLDEGVSLYDPAVYAAARANLNRLRADGFLTRDARPYLYLYRLSAGDRSQTGLACCLPAEDYAAGVVKKHELTRSVKEQDRYDHIAACSAHTGPIFIMYRALESIRAISDGWAGTRRPVYDFTTEDAVRHTMWVVDDDVAVRKLTDAFASVPSLYIADGHHRCSAAARLAGDSRGKGGDPETARFLAVLFPHDELTILDYNRVVRDLNGRTPEAFLSALADRFTVSRSQTSVKPTEANGFGLYLDGHWYALAGKEPAPRDVIAGLSVSVLQSEVLSALLGITDPQTDARIDFIGGARGTGELERCVDSGEMAAAFTVKPPALDELLAVSDAGRIMPPKSTWFEPKLLSGLLIHLFNEEAQ